MINFNTDLAVERNDIYRKANNIANDIEGIETQNQEIDDKINISRVKITNEKGAEAIGKPIGNYITIDIKKLKVADNNEIQKAAETVTKELKELIDKHTEKQGDILIVGLGNMYVTPDSLGPKVVKDIDITRHLLKYAPEYIDPQTRTIAAIAPGVLGTTGIETMEIINENLPIPLVLHGGTGIPDDKIKKAISCGISKININTDLQSVWSKAVRKFLEENKEVYDPRKIIGSGEKAIKDRIEEIVTLFGTKR